MPRQISEIAFIDPQIDDFDVLRAGLRPGVAAVLLNAAEPAPRQMARVLAGQRGLAAIHVIAHGAPGELRFAAGTLSADSIAPDDAALAACGRSLRAGGGIALWSCHAGAGAAGAALLGALSTATGTPAAASTQLVGAAARGGRWNLDRRAGGSPVRVPLTNAGIAAFRGVMATCTWVGGVSSDWNTAENWYRGIIPGLSDDVVIPTLSPACYVPALTESQKLNSISITGTTSLTITSGSVLTVTNPIVLSSSGGISGVGEIDGVIYKIGSAAATITATGGILELLQYVVDFTESLALNVATSTDELLLEADTIATSLTLNGGSVVIGGTLELATVLAIGSGFVFLSGNAGNLTSTAAGVSTISTGAISGAGTVNLSLNATGAAQIVAAGGTLELRQTVTNSGGALALLVNGAGDTLLLDAGSEATSLRFNTSGGTLEIGSAGSLTLTEALDVGAGTIKLDGNAAQLTDAAGITLDSTGGISGAGVVTGPITGTNATTATITASGGELELKSSVTNAGALALVVIGAGDTLLLDAATAATSLSFNGSSGGLEIGSAGSLTLATALTVGGGIVVLDGNAAQLTDTAGITLSSIGGIGGQLSGAGIVTGQIIVTGTATVVIAAFGGTLAMKSRVTNTGSLALEVTGAGDTLLLDAGSEATSLRFNTSGGTLEIGSAGSLSLTTALTVGAGTVKLDGNAARLTDAAGITLASTGGITGAGIVTGPITGTNTTTATIAASGGTLELNGSVTNAGSLALVVTGSGDTLLLDAATAARSLRFNNSSGTLEIGSAGSLALTTALTVGAGTVKLDGNAAQLTDAAGITLSSTGGITGAGIVTGPITGTNATTATITASGGTLELKNSVANAGTLALVVTGAGDTLLLDAATAASSLRFSGGSDTLEIGSAGSLTLTARAAGAGTVKLDGNAAQLTDAAGITLDSTGGITGAGIVTGPITGTNTATITASGGTLALQSAVTNTGSLALLVAGASDTLLLDAATAASSLRFSGGSGTLEIGSAGSLTLTARAVGVGTVKLDGNAAQLTDAAGIQLDVTGAISGAGIVIGPIFSYNTPNATITASGGTLALQGSVTNTGSLALEVTGAGDTLLLDAATAATSLNFGSSGTLEIGSAGSLTLTDLLDVGAGTVKLDGSAVQLTDAAGITLEGGTLSGGGSISAETGVTGYGTVAVAVETATVTALGGTLVLQGSVTNTGSLALLVTGANDTLLLDAATAATSLSFNGSSGTLEIGSAGSLTLTTPLTVGAGTLKLDGNAARLTDTAGINLSSTGGITGAGIVTGPITGTSTTTANIAASGGTLALQGSVTNAGSLALLVTGGSDKLLLDAAAAATSLSFNGSSGTLEIGSAGSLTLTTPLTVGAGTVKLDGNAARLTDTAGINLSSTGGITGAGIVTGQIGGTSVTNATITASGGTLELKNTVEYMHLLALVVAGAGDKLLLDGATAATSVSFNASSGTLEIGSAGSLTIMPGLTQTTALDVGAGTIKLDGSAVQLTDKAGITLEGGTLSGSGSISSDTGVTGYGTVAIAVATQKVTALGGTLDVTGQMGTGTILSIDNSSWSATLKLDHSAGATIRAVLLDAAHQTLEIAQNTTINGTQTVSGGATLMVDHGATLTDSAGVTIGSGGTLAGGGKVGAITLAGGTVEPELNEMTVGSITGYGTVSNSPNITGSVTASGGTLQFTDLVNTPETFNIANVANSVLKFDVSVFTNPTILFEGGGAGVGVLDLTAISLSQFNGVLSNIGTGEGILVNGAASVTLSPDGFTLTVYNSSNIELGTLALDRPYTGDYFHIINGNEIVICFMPGTFIRTPAGEQAVESLAIGDLVLTAEGEAQPILWIGRQTVSRVFADPLRVLPIRITAGALDENLPVRDLLVSPDHALLVGDVLIQAGALVNGTSIRREENVPRVYTYYHLELADHALILAEGVPAETFVDNVDRLAFDNWAEHVALYPAGRDIAELPLPRARSHRQVPMALRRHLAGRAAQLCPAVAAA